jgi:hypothetical protein
MVIVIDRPTDRETDAWEFVTRRLHDPDLQFVGDAWAVEPGPAGDFSTDGCLAQRAAEKAARNA